LPYEEIVQSSNQVELFINKFFEAASVVLLTYGIKREDVALAEEEVKKEITGNDH
jgi:hypothetical protein